MGTSSKAGKGKRRDERKKVEIPEHTLALRERLHDALSLGIKFYDNKRRKWQCQNAEIMSHAVRAMSAFVASITSDILQHPLIKDSFSDMLVALEGVLQSEKESVLIPATNVTGKIFNGLGSLICQYESTEIILPLSNLLSFQQTSIIIPSAVALRCILKNVASLTTDDGIWNELRKGKAIENIICILLDCIARRLPAECFIEIASLLRDILWRWPPSRYPVWNNSELMNGLVSFCAKSDPSVVVSILQLYSSLALCGDVASMLLNGPHSFLCEMLLYTHSSLSSNVRIEALTLCQHLTRSEEGCKILTSVCLEPLVQGIISAMSGWRSLHTKKVPPDQVPLVTTGCQTALIARWAGVHHAHFWKLGIDNILLDLLLGGHRLNHCLKDNDELRTAAYDNITNIRNYIWDILGWLAMHCEEGFHSEENMNSLDTLIHCACLVAVDLVFMRFRSQCHSVPKSVCTSEAEPVSRAVMIMLLSPCNHIASRTRGILSQIVNCIDKSYLDSLLDTLRLNYIGNVSMATDNLQVVINLISLVCYSSLSQFQGLILERQGIESIQSIIDKCLRGDIYVSRSSIAPHLHNSTVKTCCWNHVKGWEDGNIILLYSLQALSQLIFSFSTTSDHLVRGSGSIHSFCNKSTAESLFASLQKILSDGFNLQVKWYASYCLSHFGCYGFPSNLGMRMAGALNENELADLQLVLPDGKRLEVHGIILMARCPALLPSENVGLKRASSTDLTSSQEISSQKNSKSGSVIHLSSHVDADALIKLVEYIYTGYCQVEDSIVKPLLTLARRCSMKSLYYILKRKQPRCGAPIPRCDFTHVLAFSEQPFTDITLEAKGDAEAWNCGTCQMSVPHMHAHKIILCSSSTYMQALFQSGMQESYSQIIKVPICWEALVKLVSFFYSGELPKLEFLCAWKNMDSEQQSKELIVYVELSWLAEFWCLDDVLKQSFEVITSCLNTDQTFPLKIIESALELGQLKIVEFAVSSVAPRYPRLRDAGDFEGVSEEVVQMLQSAYARYFQETHL